VTEWDGVGSRRERGWQAASRGYRFVPRTGDVEALEAVRQLELERFAQAAEVPLRWLETQRDGLPPEWSVLSGLANTGVRLTRDELAAIDRAYEELLAPYVTRSEEDAPSDARVVRILHYVLPETPAEEQ
jgi:hypothetical protein